MLSEIRLLMGLELRGLYGINKFRYTKDKKQRRTFVLLCFLWVLLILMIAAYVGLMVYGLHFIGLSRVVPAYLMFIASLIVFAFGLFKAGSTIFSRTGYDSLCALPVRTPSIVICRFLVMYVQDLLFTLLIILPGVAVYGWLVRPGWTFYALAVLGSLFIPALPLAAATALGTLVTAVASRMKRKSLFQTFGMLLMVLVIMSCSTGLGWVAEDLTIPMLFRLADTIAMLLSRLYPPSAWFAAGWTGFALLALVSSLTAGAMLWLISRFFHAICRKLYVTSATHDYRMERLERRGVLMALYRREVKRYFASSIYVTNTIVGPIMGLVLSGAIYFAGVETILSFLPAKITHLIPFVLAAVFTMMNTTSVSISMEGKQFWILQSIPLPAKTIFDAKLLLNLSLMLPFYVLSEIFLMLSLKPSALEALWLWLIPAAIILFSVVSGISVNRKLHSFDWEKEEIIVKQSASAALGGFSGLLLSLACGATVFFFPGPLSQPVICFVILGITYLLYRMNNLTQLQNL